MTLISSLLRLSAHHLARTALALQPLKSGTLSTHLSVPVPVLIPSVVTPRPTTASRPSSPLNPSPLAPQIRLLLTIVHANKQYLLTYLLPAFAVARRAAARLLLAAGLRPVQQLIDISCPPGPQQQTCSSGVRHPMERTDRQTDRRIDIRQLHRPCFAHYAGSACLLKRSSINM